ncbi:MAG: DUF5071 domain-containing protein [Cellvibrionaceae bacterium]
MIRILPVDKGDIEACDNLALASDELLIPHIKELLSWLQDMSWPVARKISSRLSKLGLDLVPELREILNSKDEVWKYWVISRFLYDVNNTVYDALFFNLKRIQNHPTPTEKKELLDVEVDLLIRSRKTIKHIVSSDDVQSSVVNISSRAVKNKSPIHSVPVLDGGSVCSEKAIIVLNGYHFETLEEFYDELESSFAVGYEWNRNLDGFHEILKDRLKKSSNGFLIRWKNSAISQQKLGYGETIKQLKKRLQSCHPLKKKIVLDAINKAEKEEGLTVFDWIVQIIKFHTEERLTVEGKIELELI